MQPIPSPPPIPTNVIHYQRTREQVIGQWFRLRMFRPQKALLYGTLLLCGIFLILLQGPGSFFGWACIAFPFLLSFYFHRALQRIVAQHPELTEPRSMTFDQNGVVLGSATTRTQFPWSRFRRFSENRDYYHLHLDDLGSATSIPKSAFSPEQRGEFLSFARAIASR